MSEFWLWFIRPIAELAGVVAAVAVLMVLIIAYQLFASWRHKRRS